MKKPIYWHLECLDNSKRSLERKREHLARFAADVSRDAAYVSAYEKQINLALVKGKDGFDSSKFGLKPKEPKV